MSLKMASRLLTMTKLLLATYIETRMYGPVPSDFNTPSCSKLKRIALILKCEERLTY